MDITVAICTYKRYDLLQQTITALKKQSLPKKQHEILVIDNSPDPDLSIRESAKFKEIENLRWIYEATAGLSNARNVAARSARSSIVAYLDDDALAAPEWLEAKLDAFRILGSDVAVVGGKVDPWWGAPRPAWLSDKLLAYLSCIDLGPHIRLISNNEWVAGANVSYKVSSLEAAGGFSVNLGRVGSGSALLSNEEVDLIDRLKSDGKQIGYSPWARVEHWVDPSRLTQQWFKRRMAWQAVSDYIRSPDNLIKNSESAWEEVKKYIYHCPPHERTVRALSLQKISDGDFEWQMSAVYNTIVALLSGISENSYD